jgi:hypothetical protein
MAAIATNQGGNMADGQLVPPTALEPGDRFTWSGDEWRCIEQPDIKQEPGFVWVLALDFFGASINCRIGKLENVVRLFQAGENSHWSPPLGPSTEV